jgi:hypothetical protein
MWENAIDEVTDAAIFVLSEELKRNSEGKEEETWSQV